MDRETQTLIDQFKALADPVRLRVLALCSRAECSVSELTDVLSLSQPRVSQHLKLLCDARLVERFRDGHFVFYRLPAHGEDAKRVRQLLALLPDDEFEFERDIETLRALRGVFDAEPNEADRPLHRALVELTVAAPLGDLLDIGCGQARVLKLLASRAQRAVGVDIDADARRFARAEVLLADLPNCTLRQGDMYALPFEDAEFDTVIVDDVLCDAERPVEVLVEAARMIGDGGRILVLSNAAGGDPKELTMQLAGWCRDASLRLAPPRRVPSSQPRWLLAVATRAASGNVAA